MTSATARGSRPPTRAAPVQRDLDAVVYVPGAEVLGERLGPGDVAGVPGGDRRAWRARLWEIAAPMPRVPPVTKATRLISLPSGARSS